MAIQISENLLSDEAKKALKNAKSKSQFLRDAIEYYVKKDTPPAIKNDIQEIKQMLKTLCDSNIENLKKPSYQTNELYDNAKEVKKQNTIDNKDSETAADNIINDKEIFSNDENNVDNGDIPECYR